MELGLRRNRGSIKGRTIVVADAHRGDGKRFIVRADEKLTAFMALESAVRGAAWRRAPKVGPSLAIRVPG